MEKEIRELEDEFFDVAYKAAVNLGDENLPKIKMCVKLLPVSTKHTHMYLLQPEDLSAIDDAKRVDKIFSILARYWDFLNCGLLNEIIRRVGDDEMKKLMDKYLGKLKCFREKTKLGDFINKWTGKDCLDYEEFATKMGENWAERTLEDLENFRIQWSRQLSFTCYATVIKKVTKGCVTVVWGLHCSILLTTTLPSILQDVLPLLQESNVQRVMYREKCILEPKSLEVSSLTI